MEETGIVKSLSGALAIVVVERKSACDQCKAGCKVTDSGAEIEALNPVKAKIGQRVKVIMKPYTYLKGSIIIYGIPALALIIGAIIGKELLTSIHPFTSLDPDVVSAITGFGAFVLSFLVVKIWSMKIEKRIEYKPVIEEILE
ncbi:MAG: SoxR reducing system RseC family protein [Thermodesulfovibrionales bacterium]